MSKIRETKLNPIPIQTGYGVPSHISPAGSFYFDFNTGLQYKNVNGINNWQEVYGSNSPQIVAPSLSGISLDIDYINFNTNPVVPAPTGGTMYFDATENAISYKPITNNNDVTIQIGRENLLKIYNGTGVQINNGQAVTITGATSGSPSVTLAIATGNGNIYYQVDGIATHDIPNNEFGFITVFGLVRDINLTGFSTGEDIYLSQTVAGAFSSYSGLSFTGRTIQIGHVVNNSSLGTLDVQLLNEISYNDLTGRLESILTADNSSTGVFAYSGISLVTASGTTFNVGPTKGWIVDNTTNPIDPYIKYVNYAGQTGIMATYVTAATETFLLISSGGTLIQQTIKPTPQERRQNIYIGKLGHASKTFIINAFNEPDLNLSSLSQTRDMFTPIKLINDGVYPSSNGANLTFNTSSGTLYGFGIGVATNLLNPSSITFLGQTPTTFQYRTQTGGTATNRTTIDPLNYDLNGVITTIGPPAKQATNQRIYLLQNGQIRVQYGQTVYADLTTAIAAIQNESFTPFSNFKSVGILIGVLSVRSDTTNLSDTNYAKFFLVSKFGETVGAAGGVSTTTLQQAYNNSTTPEIVINSTLDGLTIENGTGNPDATTHLLEGVNAAGNTTSFINAAGGFSGTSVSAVTITTSSVTANANGLTATTISATTYQNLPTDIRQTGATYSNNTFTYTNNTGGTFNVLFNTVTGLTVNGNLTVTGNTLSTIFSGNSLTLSSSASTIYLNNSTQQQIKFFGGGTGIPTLSNYSSGAKIILYDNIDSSISTGFAIGIDTGVLWYGTDLAGDAHEWYASTRKLATLIGANGFQLFGLGSPTTAAFTISGTSSLGSKGGLGYMDFLRVYNNYPSATNPNKWFRSTSGGTLQILNNAYTATILDLTDNGILSVGGGNVATTTSSDGTSNYLTFNGNSSQLYDDGNFHIHSRSAGASMWINTNGAQLNLLTQSPVSGGGIGSGIAIATTTLNGYVTINTGRTITTAAAYGYLTTGGAGTYPGGSQSVSISLYANNRIWGQEIDAFSDERMKDIQGEVTLEEGLKLINNLKPIKYTWKEGEDKGIKIGYSAQQVSKAGFDHLISLIPREGLEETIDNDGFVSPKDTQFSMNYDQVTPYHGVVIKHLLKKIDELDNQIQELKNK